MRTSEESAVLARRGIHLLVALAFLLGAISVRAGQPPAIRYNISLAQPAQHLIHVTIDLPPGPSERQLQLPVWNALYQVRDFAQYVNWVRARNSTGTPLPTRMLNKSLWQITGTENGAQIEYESFANQPGPYGAQLDSHHAFFNLAEILMYSVDSRSAPMRVSFNDVPSGWKIATTLKPASPAEFIAENYDRLVDSPVEIGAFQESDFDESESHYRIVVDADPSEYDLKKIDTMARKIVAAATSWMNDRPFGTYLFIYHFPHEPVYGGMEHAYSTAISLSAQVLHDDPLQLASVTAHEFFHLWNVKRIRPQSLEPIDYTQENYTPALWFSEGVTSTVQDCILLRAGLENNAEYFNSLADAIGELEERPAHLAQSAEESSLGAWLEKYPYYRLPERSISYYNKGELLGVTLDLAMRNASEGRASLRDLFQWMNQNYAKQGRFFPDSKGVLQAAEAVSHADLKPFFEKYVSGTGEIPWNDFFQSVGLELVKQANAVADLGFTAARSFDAPTTVTWVNPNSAAERAGLAIGDVILEVDGRTIAPNLNRQLAVLHPGETLRLRIRNHRGEREIQWKLASRTEFEFHLKDVDNITPQQKARRAAWLKGESQ